MVRGLKNIVLVFGFFVFGILFSSWGYRGHEKIAEKSVGFFTVQMEQFVGWIPYIVDHSPDPDSRKSSDSSEGSKHYIDIDSYPEYIKYGAIPNEIDSLIIKYGRSFVYDQGILPWATFATYDSMVSCFSRRDFEKAKYFAADLSHYVADGHMPLHITSNYNGQYTGNTGIHSRYESDMVNRFLSKINYEGSELKKIENMNDYVFNYLYQSYPYIDSIIAADNYAKTVDQNTSSSAYTDAIWKKTETFTNELFRRASYAYSEIFYNAWMEAGSPNIDDNTDVNKSDFNAFQITSISSDNDKNLVVNYFLPESDSLSIEMIDINGKIIQQISQSIQVAGDNELLLTTNGYISGVYFLILKSSNEIAIKKIVIL